MDIEEKKQIIKKRWPECYVHKSTKDVISPPYPLYMLLTEKGSHYTLGVGTHTEDSLWEDAYGRQFIPGFIGTTCDASSYNMPPDGVVMDLAPEEAIIDWYKKYKERV